MAEKRETSWFLIGQEHAPGPPVLYWRCRSCDRTRMQLADLPDALQLADAIRAEWERQHGKDHQGYDPVDFGDQLRLELWHAYTDWDGRGRFHGFATFRLRGRAVSYFRKQRGQNGHRKAHAGAASLDQLAEDVGLDAAFGRDPVDGGEDRASPLARELARRRGRLVELDARKAHHPRVAREEDARHAC